jgi:YrbI family 3-deoxy-D-manno-octulosonate 8-phosphate phosphatase
VGVNHDYTRRPRRQDRRAEFIETGAGYAFRRDGFLAARHRFFGRTAMVETPDAPPFELDEAADFERVEALMLARPPAPNRPLPTSLDLVVFDFDGVMTDDRVLIDETGREAVSCSRGDGLGIERLRKAGIPMLVLSKEENAVVRARCRKLGVESFHGIEDKLALLQRLCGERHVLLSNCIYMGNDVNDLGCMSVVGFAVAPLDARPEVRAKADLVVTAPGGRGAVRALCDRLLGHYAKSADS